jgi:hypothetical protein
MIGGHNEWEIEEAFYTNKRGIDPEKAHIFVILRWMYHGDFRPLAAAIREGGAIDDARRVLISSGDRQTCQQ